MFSRTMPRAAPRLSAFTQREAQTAPRACMCSHLPARTWRPAQQQRQLGRRYRSTIREQFREQFHRSPVLFPIAVTSIALLSCFCVFYIPWYYQNFIIKPYRRFPEPVAQKLRKAVFYSRGRWLDIREASKHFRQALALANEMGMDPFSEEIMSVRFVIALLFERADHYSLAVDVLEILRDDCQRWVDEYSHEHFTDGKRSRVMKDMVRIHLKLAQLYDTRYVNEPESAEKRLVEVVESVLREKQRREKEGVKEGEGSWLTDDEMGATLEALGTHYEQFDSHYLATPLFVKALELCPPNSCHGVVLMNNISSCLAQQSTPSSADAITMSTEPSDFPITNKAPRAVLIDQARQWATKALAHASTIKPPDRNEECDQGCAVATHNLGEFFEMEGKIKDARQKYEEAASLSKAVGFTDGKANARAGLMRLKQLEKTAQ